MGKQFVALERAAAVERRGGKAMVAEPPPHSTPKSGGRLNGNPFESEQGNGQEVVLRGRQVVPREIDLHRIHPSTNVHDCRKEASAKSFEDSPFTILPDRERKFVPCRRVSTEYHLNHQQPQLLARSGSDDSIGSANNDGVAPQKPPRLRLNQTEESLRRLMPPEDTRKRQSVSHMELGVNLVEAMVRNNYPVARAPHRLEQELPPLHTRPAANKYDSHLPFGPSVGAPPEKELQCKRRTYGPPPPQPPLPDVPTSGRRLFPVGVTVPFQGGENLIRFGN